MKGTNEDGATAVEYAILVSLVAVVIVVAVALFGTRTSGMFDYAANSLVSNCQRKGLCTRGSCRTLDVRGSSYGEGMFHSPAPDVESTLTSARVRLALLVCMRPGTDVVDALGEIDECRLEPVDAVTFLQVVERITAWLRSRRNAALIAAASPVPRVEEFTILEPDDRERTFRIADVVREEIAVALRWTHSAAQREIDSARILAGPLLATGSALAAGEISAQHAQVLVEHARRLPGALAAAVAADCGGSVGLADDEAVERAQFAVACQALQARVLPTARRNTVARTHTQANRVVLAIDAEGVQRRRREALCTRDVYVSDQLDGMSVLIARMATEHAHAILSGLDATAKADQTSPLTMGERRTEALLDAVLAADCPARTRADEPRMRAHLDLVIDLPTLLALRHELAPSHGLATDDGLPVHDSETGSVCGEARLRGVGAIPAVAVRELLADPEVAITLRRMICDPTTGHLLDYGRRTYAIPDRLREFIVARDRTCRFPGCRKRADRCQIDHAMAFDEGGSTSPANLGALCVRHHQLKTHARWRITSSEPDGACTWTSPQERTYEHDPGPVFGPTPF